MYLTLRGKSLSELFDSIIHANLFWIGMNGVALIFVFLLRAYRWRLLIQNSGENPKYIFVLYSLLMGFFVNSFTPRLGEVARCTALKQSNDIAISKSLGTMVTERIWDLLVLMVGVAVVFFLELGRLQPVWNELISGVQQMVQQNLLLFVVIIAGMVLLVIIAIWILRRRKTFEKGKQFINEFWQTLRLSFKIKKYPRFLLITFLIWGILVFMNYFSLLALKETSGYSIYFAFILLFVVGIGWAIPSPSGIGTTHFIVLQVFLAFDLPQAGGVAYGVLSNGLTFSFTIIIGGLGLIIYQLISRKRSKV